MIRIAGIMRAGAYSPNHIGNDAAIFNATADELRKRGCTVDVFSEEKFIETDMPDYPVIVNMCRERASIEKLQQLQEQGRIVINSGFGIENCTRELMTRLLMAKGIPYPDSLIVNTNESVSRQLKEAGFSSCWIKRGDFHAMHKEDVSYCRHIEEAQDMLQEYWLRGIRRAVINRHLEGDLIKFYGVSGQPFFYWFYPFDMGHSKYGYEAVNGKSQGIPFSLDYLKEICQKASDTLEVRIYGGDCIVDPDGSIRIIDFNDWPSFAPCRKEASPHIAKCILKAAKEA